MLATWPELLFLSPFAAFFVRLALAVLFARVAYRRARTRSRVLSAFAVVDAAIAIALFFGTMTQVAAFAATICTGAWLLRPSWRPCPRSTCALALVMAITLIITGPGPFAYDLPL